MVSGFRFSSVFHQAAPGARPWGERPEPRWRRVRASVLDQRLRPARDAQIVCLVRTQAPQNRAGRAHHLPTGMHRRRGRSRAFAAGRTGSTEFIKLRRPLPSLTAWKDGLYLRDGGCSGRSTSFRADPKKRIKIFFEPGGGNVSFLCPPTGHGGKLDGLSNQRLEVESRLSRPLHLARGVRDYKIMCSRSARRRRHGINYSQCRLYEGLHSGGRAIAFFRKSLPKSSLPFQRLCAKHNFWILRLSLELPPIAQEI